MKYWEYLFRTERSFWIPYRMKLLYLWKKTTTNSFSNARSLPICGDQAQISTRTRWQSTICSVPHYVCSRYRADSEATRSQLFRNENEYIRRSILPVIHNFEITHMRKRIPFKYDHPESNIWLKPEPNYRQRSCTTHKIKNTRTPQCIVLCCPTTWHPYCRRLCFCIVLRKNGRLSPVKVRLIPPFFDSRSTYAYNHQSFIITFNPLFGIKRLIVVHLPGCVIACMCTVW